MTVTLRLRDKFGILTDAPPPPRLSTPTKAAAAAREGVSVEGVELEGLGGASAADEASTAGKTSTRAGGEVAEAAEVSFLSVDDVEGSVFFVTPRASSVTHGPAPCFLRDTESVRSFSSPGAGGGCGGRGECRGDHGDRAQLGHGRGGGDAAHSELRGRQSRGGVRCSAGHHGHVAHTHAGRWGSCVAQHRRPLRHPGA